MADWNEPSLSSAYADFLDFLAARDVDAATFFTSAPTNQPEGAMRYVRVSNKFQESLSSVWTDKQLSVAGGGTGAGTAVNARTNLGLGTMAVQDANNVAITGGTLSGVSADANIITSGNLDVAVMPLDGDWTLTGHLNVVGSRFKVDNFAGRVYGSVSVNYNLSDTDFTYSSDGGDVNLPAAAGANGLFYIVRNNTGVALTVNSFGAETIEEEGNLSTSIDLPNLGDIVILQCLGLPGGTGWPNWIVISRNRNSGMISIQQIFEEALFVTSSSVQTFNITLGTTLTDYTKAEISDAIWNGITTDIVQSYRLTSNTNLEVKTRAGLQGLSFTIYFTCFIKEYDI